MGEGSSLGSQPAISRHTDWVEQGSLEWQSKPLPSLAEPRSPWSLNRSQLLEDIKLESKSLKEKTLLKELVWKGRWFIYKTLCSIHFSRSEFYLWRVSSFTLLFSTYRIWTSKAFYKIFDWFCFAVRIAPNMGNFTSFKLTGGSTAVVEIKYQKVKHKMFSLIQLIAENKK